MPRGDKSHKQQGTSQADGDSIVVSNLRGLRLELSELTRLEKCVEKCGRSASSAFEQNYVAAKQRRDAHLHIVRAHACEALGLKEKT